ncbi:MAG: DUF4166 domain-containing protein [Thiolinea sp.]
MEQQALMQQALGSQWEQLPAGLQAHYQPGRNTDVGTLDIEYPGFMQPYLSFMRLLGALVNQRGKALPTTVEKYMEGGTQRWKRSIRFPDGKVIYFKSHWQYARGNELIEYVSPFIGFAYGGVGTAWTAALCRAAFCTPAGWLAVADTGVADTRTHDDCETAREGRFEMDFRLTHPLFGQIFRYAGSFGQSRADVLLSLSRGSVKLYCVTRVKRDGSQGWKHVSWQQ